ncbi:MAG TPA: transposase, partial [Vicinamibacterales bacterium]
MSRYILAKAETFDWTEARIRYEKQRIEHRQLGPIAAIGVDEIQYAKGHKYLTLVYQIEQHCTRLLWIGRER